VCEGGREGGREGERERERESLRVCYLFFGSCTRWGPRELLNLVPSVVLIYTYTYTCIYKPFLWQLRASGSK